MKQVFCHYKLWEDWQNGMFKTTCDEVDLKTNLCKELLSSPSEFLYAMNEMTTKWPNCTNENLSNSAQNRKSWLGAAACSFNYNAPEFVTRIAWNSLTKEQQIMANEAAQQIITMYESRVRN